MVNLPPRLCLRLRNKNLHCFRASLRTPTRSANYHVNSLRSFIWSSLGYITLVIQKKRFSHVWCYASDGVVGEGWGWWRSLHLHTCVMLRKCRCFWSQTHLYTWKKYMIFEKKSYIIDIGNMSKSAFYHSEMLFWHSACCFFLWLHTRCDRADEKQMTRASAPLCYKAQLAKIRVSPQRKQHFWCLSIDNTLRSRGEPQHIPLRCRVRKIEIFVRGRIWLDNSGVACTLDRYAPWN